MIVPFSEKLKFEKEKYKINKFLIDKLPETDCQPIGQRPPVWENPQNDKNVAIIKSIFFGINIGEITLVKVEGDEFSYESVDGGHRKRAIRDYYDNLFYIEINGEKKTYDDLNDDEKKIFQDYELSFCVYDSLSNAAKGYVFRCINQTTDVNNQEMLNSFGDISIANAIRETVRESFGVAHDLFEMTKEKNFKWVDYTNNRLKLEEFVARIYSRYHDDGFVGKMDDSELFKMYNDENIKTKSIKKKVDAHLDFLLSMCVVKKNILNKMGWKELNTLSKLYFYLNQEIGYGKWKIRDGKVDDFYKNFYDVYSDYIEDADEKYKDIVDFDFESAEVTIKECFRNYTTCYNNTDKQVQLIKWIVKHKGLNINKTVLILDGTRLFTKSQKETALARQKYKCAVDGEDLPYEDAEGAHDLAYILGGETKMKNLAMVRKTHNKKMGTMTIKQYKELLGYK